MDNAQVAQEEKSAAMEYQEMEGLGWETDPFITQQLNSAIKEVSEAAKREVAKQTAKQNKRIAELADQVHTLQVNVEDVHESVAAVNTKVDTIIGKVEELIRGIGVSKKGKKKKKDNDYE